jgi:hypothetical protein
MTIHHYSPSLDRAPPRLITPLAFTALVAALATAPPRAHAEGVDGIQAIVPAWSGPSNNWPFSSGIDAAVNWTETAGRYSPTGQTAAYGAASGGREGKLYFFRGAMYSRYDIANDRTDPGYPKPIAGHWPGFPAAFTAGVDAAVNWGNLNPNFANKIYFFKGNQYLRYDIAKDAVDAGYPQPLDAAHWMGWPAAPSAFASGVDAALNYGNGKVYFFKGSEYLRFDIAADRVDQPPQPIVGHWSGWPAGWTSVDDAVDTGNGKVYFFHGTQYARYDKGYLSPPTKSNIKHVVLIVQENHTFDSYLGHYCTGSLGLPCSALGGFGASCCEAVPLSDCATHPSQPCLSRLDDSSNAAFGPNHDSASEICEIHGGAMDRFAAGCAGSDPRNVAAVPSQLLLRSASDPLAPGLATYVNLANGGALADRYFQPFAGPSYPNNAYFTAARFLFGNNDAAVAGACKMPGPHLGSLLADHDVTWAAYLQEGGNGDGNGAANTCGVYNYGDNPFGYFPRANFWDANWTYTRQLSRLATDVANGTLPAFSFVKPQNDQSEHPGGVSISAGEQFVERVIDTVLGPTDNPSSYYSDTLVLLTWDEGGGYWDHVSPPDKTAVDNIGGYGGAVPYGTRVPLIAIGRFAKHGYISHVAMEHASIAQFAEWNWLGGVTGQINALLLPTNYARDAFANNIGDLLDVNQTGVAVPRTP